MLMLLLILMLMRSPGTSVGRKMVFTLISYLCRIQLHVSIQYDGAFWLLWSQPVLAGSDGLSSF